MQGHFCRHLSWNDNYVEWILRFLSPTYVQNITFHKDSRFLFQPCIRVLIYTHSHIPFQLHTPVSLDYLPAANNIFSPAFIFYSVFSHQGSNNHESFSMPSRFLFLCSEAQGLFSNCSFFRYSRSNFIFFCNKQCFLGLSFSLKFLEAHFSFLSPPLSLSSSLSTFLSLIWAKVTFRIFSLKMHQCVRERGKNMLDI